jgi:hypothetical protein
MHNAFISVSYLKSYDARGGLLRLKAKPNEPTEFFSVFEAFSFLLDDGLAGWIANKQ